MANNIANMTPNLKLANTSSEIHKKLYILNTADNHIQLTTKESSSTGPKRSKISILQPEPIEPIVSEDPVV